MSAGSTAEPRTRLAALLELDGLKLGLLLLVGAALLRSASLAFGVMDIDEAHWTLIGKVIRQGGLPYRDIADHKPPLLFFLYALLGAPGGGRLQVTHALMLPWIAGTALLCGATTRRLTCSAAAGTASALAYLLLCCSNLHTASSELLADLPVAAALAVLPLRAPDRGWRALPAGLLLGLAVLVRPQAGIGLCAALFCLLLLRRGAGARLGALLLCMVGFLVPLAVTVWAFARCGELSSLFDWTVRRNLGYPPPAGWIFVFLIYTATYGLPLLWALLLGGPSLSKAARDLLARRRPDELVVLGGALLGLACLGVAQGRRFYAHYYVQLALPLALLAGPALASLASGRERRRRQLLVVAGLLAGLSALAFAAVGWVRGALSNFPSQDPRAASVVAFLRSPAAPPGRLLLWGDYSHIYLDAGRLPGARFYNAAPLVGNFDARQVPEGFDVSRHVSTRDVALYLEDARRLGPTVLVDTSTGPIHSWDRFPMRKVEPIWDYVQRTFHLAGHTDGGDIYVR